MIIRLKEWGCLSVDILEEYNQQSSLGKEQEYFIEEHAKIVVAIGDAFNKVRRFKEVLLSEIMDIANSTIKRLLNLNSVISYLHLINNKDDYTFRHSLNVAVISGVIGKWLHFSEGQIMNIVHLIFWLFYL